MITFSLLAIWDVYGGRTLAGRIWIFSGYPGSGHFSALFGRILDYFEQRFKIYHFHQLFFCPYLYLLKMANK